MIKRRGLHCLMQYSLGKVTSHQKVANISDFVEYDGNYHKEYEVRNHSFWLFLLISLLVSHRKEIRCEVTLTMRHNWIKISNMVQKMA